MENSLIFGGIPSDPLLIQWILMAQWLKKMPGRVQNEKARLRLGDFGIVTWIG